MTSKNVVLCLVGLGCSSLFVPLLNRQLSKLQVGNSVSSVLRILVWTVGAITGYWIQFASFLDALVLTSISILLCIQLPIDLLTHQLLRAPTLMVLAGVASIRIAQFAISGSISDAITVMAMPVLLVFWLWIVHRVSSDSFGRGDVLLSAPIAVALSPLGLSGLLLWLLIASTACCLHAIVLIRKRVKKLPFGPHLLGSAWVMLLASL